MLNALLLVLGVLVPVAYLFYTQMQASAPSMRWPKVARMLKLEYSEDPPTMQGVWNGKKVAVVHLGTSAKATALLARRSCLRVEVGPKDLVTKRAGMIVADPVETGDPAFDARLLARCSDKAQGPAIFDPVLRQRLMAQAHVDIVGQEDGVQWTVPTANDPDQLEGMLEILGVLATEMERFPA